MMIGFLETRTEMIQRAGMIIQIAPLDGRICFHLRLSAKIMVCMIFGSFFFADQFWRMIMREHFGSRCCSIGRDTICYGPNKTGGRNGDEKQIDSESSKPQRQGGSRMINLSQYTHRSLPVCINGGNGN